MARPRIKVTIEGVADVKSRLQDPRMIDRPMVELLTDVTKLGTKVAVDGVDGGTGAAVRSIQGKVDSRQARIVTMMPTARAKSIDQGRRPGTSLKELLPQLIRWREAVGHPETGIVIAKQVKARGVKGRFFKQATRDAVQGRLPRFLKELEAKLEGFWKRGSR